MGGTVDARVRRPRRLTAASMVVVLLVGAGLLLHGVAQADETMAVRLVPVGSVPLDAGKVLDLASATSFAQARDALLALKAGDPAPTTTSTSTSTSTTVPGATTTTTAPDETTTTSAPGATTTTTAPEGATTTTTAVGASDGTVYLPLAVPGLPALDLPSTTITTLDATRTIVLRSHAQAFAGEADVDATLVVDWPDVGGGGAAPQISLVLHGSDISLATLNPSWPGTGIVPTFRDAWVMATTSAHELQVGPLRDAVGDAVPPVDTTLAAGVTFRGSLDADATLGAPLRAAGLSATDLTVTGTLGSDGGLLGGEPATGMTLHADAVKDPAAPAWLKAATASVSFEVGADGARFAAGGDYTLDLGGQEATFTGGVSVAASTGSARFTAELHHAGALTLPAPLDWVTIDEATAELSAGTAGLDAHLGGTVTVGTSHVAVDVTLAVHDGNVDVDLALDGPLSAADAAGALGSAVGTVDTGAVEGLRAVTLDRLAVAVHVGTDGTSVTGTGAATIRGAKADLLLSATAEGTEARVLAGFRLAPPGGGCCATLGDLLGPSVTGAAADLRIPSVDLVFVGGTRSLTAADLTEAESAWFRDVYGQDLDTLELPAGLSLAADVPVDGLGKTGLDLLGLHAGQQVRLEGYVGTDLGLVGRTEAGNLPGLSLKAVLPESSDSTALPSWLGLRSQWTLELKAVQSAVDLRATARVQARLGETTFPEATIVAAFTKDAEGTRATLDAELAPWNDPFGLTWLDLTELKVHAGAETPVGGTTTVKSSLTGAFTVTATGGEPKRFEVGLDVVVGDGSKVHVRAALADPITVADVVRFVGADPAPLPGPLAGAFVGPVEVEAELATGVDPVVTVDAVGGLPLTSDFTLSARAMLRIRDGKFTLGIRPERGGDPVTLFDVLPASVRATFPAGLDLPLPAFGVVVSSQAQPQVSSTELPKAERDFYAPLYGCAVAAPSCTFQHRLDAGVTVLSALTLPTSISDLTKDFNVDLSRPVQLRGTLPLFGGAGDPNLSIALPAPKIDGLPEFLEDAALELRISTTGLSVSGDLTLKMPREGEKPTGTTCARGVYRKVKVAEPLFSSNIVTHERCYDLLQFRASGGVVWDAGSAAVTLSGQFVASGPNGWMSPFGVGDWVGIKRAAVALQVIPSSNTLALGLQADVRIAGKDLAASIAVALNIVAPSPPFVVPELIGFRVSSASGFEIQDLVEIQHQFAAAAATVAGDPVPPKLELADAGLPNLAVRNLDLMYARQTNQDLCMRAGFVLSADLYVNPIEGAPPPAYDDRGCRQLPIGAKQTVTPQCASAEEKAKGCFASVRLQVTTSGIVAEGSLGAFTVGTLKWDDAAVSFGLTLNDLPHLTVTGGASVPGLFSGQIDLALSKEAMHLRGDVDLLDGKATAHLDAEANLDLANPVFQVSASLHADFTNAASQALDGPLRGVRTSVVAIDQLWQTLLDLSDPAKNQAETLRSIPTKLRAAGVPVDPVVEQLITTAADIEQNLKVFGGGALVVDTILNGIQFPDYPGWEQKFVPETPRCLGFTTNGGCWLIPPVWLPHFEWFDLFGCFCTRYVPDRWDYTFAIAIPVSQPACVGQVVGGKCYVWPFVPAKGPKIPGVCSLDPRLAVLGHCTLRDVVEKVIGPEVGKVVAAVTGLPAPTSLSDFLDQMANKLDAGLGAVRVDCAEFGFRLGGGATAPTGNVNMRVKANVFGSPIGFQTNWNLGGDVASSATAALGTAVDSLLHPQSISCTPPPSDPWGPDLTLAAPDRVTENGDLAVTGTFAAAGTRDVTLDWGDGTTSTVHVSGKTFDATHRYRDDDPTGTAGASYLVRARYADGQPPATRLLTVANAAPSDLQATVTAATEGSPSVLRGTFTDPGELDTHRLEVTWGDGGEPQVVDLAPGARSFELPHAYAADGVYDVDVVVTDDDTGSASVSTRATVANDAPHGLEVALDTAAIDEGGTTKLTASFLDVGADDPHTAVVHWGDGSPDQTVELALGARGFDLAHAWADDDHPAVKVTVTDDDASASATTGLDVRNVAPSNVQVGVAVEAGATGGLDVDGAAAEGAPAVVAGTFSDPGTLDTHVVTIAWGDGSEDSTVRLPAGEGSFRVEHTFADDDPTGTPDGLAAITVTVRDDDDGASSAATSVKVVNRAPSGVTFVPAGPVDEAAAVTYHGTFVDPGMNDTFVADVDWGDGTSSRVELAADARTFDVDHTYADDAPTPAPVDRYAVKVTITDDDSGVGVLATGVDVRNVAPPAVELTVDHARIDENGSVVLDGSFTDPGTLDAHQVLVDWGDGSPRTTVRPEVGGRGFTAAHRYLDDDPSRTARDTYTVVATVTDDDSGSGVASTPVIVEDVAPVVARLTPGGRIDEAAAVTYAGTFSDPGSTDTHRVVIDWADGTPDAVLDLPVGARSFRTDHTYADDDPTATPDDDLPITVTVTDDDGLAGTSTTTVTVHDVAPAVTAFAPQAADEAATVTYSGTFTDPGARDRHTVVLAWADGTDDTVLRLPAGARTFEAKHVFADDDPTGTAADEYPVTVLVTDDDTLSAERTTAVTIRNVAPSALALEVEPATFAEDGTTTLSATFADPGTRDTFRAKVDWGEGTVDTIEVLAGQRAFTTAHHYGDDGTFPVRVTVTDDDTGSATAATKVVVTNVAPTVGVNRTTPQWIAAPAGLTTTTRIGEERTFAARSTDPGSDDLTWRWTWGDGLIATGVHRNAGTGADPHPSPTVGPRDVVDTQRHAWAAPCLYQVPVQVDDDDAGRSPVDPMWVVVTASRGGRHGTGWWYSRYDGKGGNELPATVQACYLKIASHLSTVFGEARPMSTSAQAAAVLKGAGADPRDKLDRGLLSLWLDYADGAFRWEDQVDTNGDGRADAVFSEVMAAAERVRLDSGASASALTAQRQRLERMTLPGRSVPRDDAFDA